MNSYVIVEVFIKSIEGYSKKLTIDFSKSRMEFPLDTAWNRTYP